MNEANCDVYNSLMKVFASMQKEMPKQSPGKNKIWVRFRLHTTEGTIIRRWGRIKVLPVRS